MKYTRETLTNINQRYCSSHCLTDSDVKMANDYVHLIESTRSKEIPKVGDRIRYTTKHGDYYERGHIEKVDDKEVYICEQPYIPFIWSKEDGIGCITSGGAWAYIPVEKLKYVGEEEKTFCDWGCCGARADGAVDFKAKVSVWEYAEEQKYPYTTKTHERMFVSYDPKHLHDSRYILYGRDSNGMNSNAWSNVLDFQAWLETVKGEVFEGNWDNQIIVWYWKQKKVHVSPKEYERIDGVEDTMLCNGCRRCKRVYDEENHTVTTYFVWYWDDDSIPDWRERSMAQNEIRERLYGLGHGVKPNEAARRKIIAEKIVPVDVLSYFKKSK